MFQVVFTLCELMSTAGSSGLPKQAMLSQQ